MRPLESVDVRPTEERWKPRAFREGTDPDPRFTLANERTFLAWIRTALGIIAAAVGLEAFAADVIDSAVRTVIACGLLIFAAGLALVALLRWIGVERAMRTARPLPLPWTAFLVAVLLAVAGIGLTVAIVV